MEVQDGFVEVAGVLCVRHDTSALEGWLIMHGLRRVICGGDEFPLRGGKLAVIASQPLMPKELDFIGEMSAGGSFPPVEDFLEQTGKVIGVVDFEVVRKTDLPGWDGTPNPAILSNPHWLKDGKLVPVPPDVLWSEERHRGRPRRGRSSGSDRRRR